MAGSQEPPASFPPRARRAQVLDRANHDRLRARLHTRTPDADVLRLIYRFLKAGVVVDRQIASTPTGVTVRAAWNTRQSAHGLWRWSKTPALVLALPLRYFEKLVVPPLAAR
ncbi:MAG: hypothetical protein KAX64_05530 [Chromatiaceae bacterium]|nr:hypothetical protein [Chromatiaceae bacterium]